MLYKEIRPKKFEDVIGNKSTVRDLQGLVSRKPNDRPHTILLSGPKGCGKTTLARITATEFGTHESNIRKLNTANVRGIDTAREIISEASCYPIGGGSLAYILDEAHQITKDAQNALLDILEETPEHVYFFLCTTDPQKLIPTLRNRCSKYTVEQLNTNNILHILQRARKIKEIEQADEVLEVIASNCDRTPRTALVILEKIRDLTDIDEIAEAIASEIDSMEKGEFFKLFKMLLVMPEKRKKNWQKIVEECEKLDSHPEQIRQGLLTCLRKQLFKIDPDDIDYAQEISRMMRKLSTTTYGGGKSQLAALLLEICFEEWK